MTWVELRVHGVSGAPPETLLGVPHVEQVAGNDHSRFFRPSGGGSGHVLEGYHWGPAGSPRSCTSSPAPHCGRRRSCRRR